MKTLIQAKRQKGVASVGIAFLLTLIMAGAVATSFGVAGSASRDTNLAEQRAQALFLAESGLETASVVFGLASTLVNCTGLNNTVTSLVQNGVNVGSYSTVASFVSSTGECLVRVSGKTANGQVVRTIESSLQPLSPSAPTNAQGKSNFTSNVPAGTDIMLVRATWTSTVNNMDSSVKYSSEDLDTVCWLFVFCDPIKRSTGNSTYTYTKWFYNISPPSGSGTGTIAITPTTSQPVNVTINVVNLGGFDGSSPFSIVWEIANMIYGGVAPPSNRTGVIKGWREVVATPS